MFMLDLVNIFIVIHYMFIREVKQKGKRGKQYIYHRLCEAIRTEAGPRQRSIINLGTLSLPKEKWSHFASRIAANIKGQISFLEEDAEIESLAYYHAQRILNKEHSGRDNLPVAEVLLNTLEVIDSRTIGAEGVGLSWFRYLKFDNLFSRLGFSIRQRNLAIASILGRLIFPGSERRTGFWIKRLSGLGELLGTDFKGISRNSLYEITDLIYQNKEEIEKHLGEQEQDLFNLGEHIILYDLTNTYFEGQACGNKKARFGRSKDKRSDCRLVTLGLIVDEHGFPKKTRLFAGNQGESQTLKEMVLELAKGCMHHDKPITVVIDAGIASEENLAMLTEEGIYYIVVSKKSYPFPEEEELETIIEKKKQKIQVALVCEKNEQVLYVKSCGKEQKEKSMKSKFEQLFEEELDKLAAGLTRKHTTKRYEKVLERIGRLREKYKRISSYYDINVEKESNLATCIKYEQKRSQQLNERYSGSYFLRTNRQDLDKGTIWHIYNLIRRIESSFESLKSHLGFRPIYHQKEERSDAHLFVSVLAYHILNSIEHRLRMCGDHRNWNTIRTILSNHTRVTVIQRDNNNQSYRVRINVTPNDEQSKIYRNLLVKETMLLPKLIPN